jgi:hypothetical protein
VLLLLLLLLLLLANCVRDHVQVRQLLRMLLLVAGVKFRGFSYNCTAIDPMDCFASCCYCCWCC